MPSQRTGSTISTLLHDQINPKDYQVLSLGDSGFLRFFRIVSSDDKANPRVPDFFKQTMESRSLHGIKLPSWNQDPFMESRSLTRIMKPSTAFIRDATDPVASRRRDAGATAKMGSAGKWAARAAVEGRVELEMCIPKHWILRATWRIIPVSKWLVTPTYKPFRPFGKGTTLLRGLTITMVINHLLTGMILQVVGLPHVCAKFAKAAKIFQAMK